MSRLGTVGLAMALLFGAAGCTSSSGPPVVSIQITPASTTVTPGATAQFGSTVRGTGNTAVTWEVNGTVGGDGTHGTISANGLYLAPAAVPSPNTVTVTVVSKADTAKSAAATVTIQVQTLPVAVSPTTATVAAGGQQAFTATQNGQPSTNSVTWSVSCKSQSASGCGSISSSGLFTAPLSPPPGGTVTITATSQNGAQIATAIATIGWSSATLTGQYAFSLSGTGSAGFEVAAGSITTDGNGNITAGAEDVTQAGTQTASITGGTYSVGADGRGTATIQTSIGTMTWQFVMVNSAHGYIVRADSGTVAGTIDLQNSGQFGLASISGPYALSLTGVDGGNATLLLAGAFTGNGSGGTTHGLSDTNDAGVVASSGALNGVFTAPNASGRGTLALTTGAASRTFTFYVVDATRMKLAETDPSSTLSGEIVQQSGGPFTAANFTGGYAFTAGGSSSALPAGIGGIFAFDGKGNITAGTMDVNDNGTFSTSSFTGTYTVADATTGRTTVTLNLSGGSLSGDSLSYAFYPKGSGGAYLVEADSVMTVSGLAAVQTFPSACSTGSGAATGFCLAAFQGSYALSLNGSDLTSPHVGREAVTGQLTFANQLGNVVQGFLSGTVDISDAGTVSPAISLLGNGSPPCALSCYTITMSNGRGTAPLTTSLSSFTNVELNLYAIDSAHAFFLEIDSARVLVGEVQQQY